MKKAMFLPFIILVLFARIPLMAQVEGWPIKAIDNNGNFMDIKAFSDDGEVMDLMALRADEGNHFFDVKAIRDNEPIAVKMVISNDFYVPIKAVTPDGIIYDVKALDKNGKKLDVKGVARTGSTIKVAVIDENEKFLPVKALSPEGQTRDVFGVKFKDDNVEMEIGGVKILAHIKALPAPNANSEQVVWNVKAIDPDGNALPIYGLDKNGNEHEVRAIVYGGSYYILNIKSIVFKYEQPVKLIKEDNTVYLATINDPGEIIPIKAKTPSGGYLDILGFSDQGRIFDIQAVKNNQIKYVVKAISENGDIYDVKGIKTTTDDHEGELNGFVHKNFFYAHVKALPTFQ